MVEVREYPEEFYEIGGKKFTARAMTREEVMLWNQDFQNLVNNVGEDAKSEQIKTILLKNELPIFKMTRCTLSKAKLPYEGRATNGNGIALDWVRAIDVIGSVAWDVSITATGLQNWWDKTTAAGTAMTLNDKTGVIILGLVNDIADPKTDAVTWKKDGSELGGHALNWKFTDTKVVEEPMPIIVLPEGTILGKLHANYTGTERVIPIAIKATTGDRLRDPTTGDLE